ncbi:hypothetical protein N8561_01430 [bacterium]|nr:hypothetical protein [bacterium]
MLVKHNNNSISSITTPGSLAQGKMTLISEQTASGSASISFTSGIDSTYPIYRFEFINIHPATDNAEFEFNFSTDGGSNYNVTKTSTHFQAYHLEDGSSAGILYQTSHHLAQSTAFQTLSNDVGNANDESTSGTLTIYNPSSTTFVKHFIGTLNNTQGGNYQTNYFVAGYGNTTSAVNALKFQFNEGNIDDGTIKLYGIKGD